MQPVIVWFRQDLRLHDHSALSRAATAGGPVIPLYIFDETSPGARPLGGAARWWLNRSLAALAQSLEDLGSRLILRRGPAQEVLGALSAETKASAVHTQAVYEPAAMALEDTLHTALATKGIAFKRFDGAMLKRPGSIRTQSGQPFKVYTPFWRAFGDAPPVAIPRPAPETIPAPTSWPQSDALASWNLHPEKPDWSDGIAQSWTPGEAGARAQLETFLDEILPTYAATRNLPAQHGTSRLSPHLQFGEISPATCWHAAITAAHRHEDDGRPSSAGLDTFQRELVWREFCTNLLINWPALPNEPFRPEFARFPFRQDAAGLAAWQRGLTGYPIVDAGMRELWHTGWMHNRVRMIVASFLVKDLLIDWRDGEAWFWDTLVDASLGANVANWQWVAGCGADAAPYFRIFNPVLQGEKFDPAGRYVQRWVPELAKLPSAHVHAPWKAPNGVLSAAGVTLGATYPHPLVDHASARDRALSALDELKSTTR